ncbi:hypothetical protein TPHA_0J00510 [Tetrapisispora phaffii CBS 4417]|uniref:RNA polymerase I-specific transcription initiation factor RRN11 n=1 Tax=Tetrapisispora phaffii (strain ATCC 24235 / CBS 4417 / NBRC 1672 / NRRL Y-8282 / UCD 70-5) TaxID=1071381 RepID=G8BYD2_TETPH|nr:hypothetical protein TPHA_0J00510 [Tetrapisispora phaffii CBS 4417]CCE64874.1 hypothetical protein TPHA_0J00510 [Tetrapisispora phaffii CBS 4417]
MFELPVSSNITINAFNLKKLRYQYINDINAKHNELSKNELPTPVTSENDTGGEDLDGDSEHNLTSEDAEVAQERRIRRWKSIMGEAIDDDEDDNNHDDDVDNEFEDNGPTDEEKKYFLRYDKPQESFEKWESNNLKRQRHVNKNFITYYRFKKTRKQIDKKYKVKTMHLNKNVKNNFELMIDGFEPINDNNISRNRNLQNYNKHHLSLLTDLMYSNIFKQKWDIAYKCFTFLLRIPDVDIRRVWNLGSIILQNIDTTKLIDFLQWLSNVYSNKNRSFVQGINYRNDQTNFNGGSRRLTPLYTKTLLWHKLTLSSDSETCESEIDSLIEQIAEMVVIPPYSEDNEIWYIFALCHLVKADNLSEKLYFMSRRNPEVDEMDTYPYDTEIYNNKITICINNCKKYLRKATQDKNFDYPARTIETKLKTIETRTFDFESMPE